MGAKNTAIAFGDFEITVALKKCATPRDLKTEYVNPKGETVTVGGGGRGGSRTPAPGVEKAVRVSEKHVVRLPADELDRIADESKDRYETMQVLETIDYRQVPTERITGAYWLAPSAGSARGLRLLARALRNTGRVAVVKWVSTSREKLGVIRVRGEEDKLALLLSELTFANEFDPPDEDVLSINDVEGEDPRSVEVAERLVKAFARSDEPAIDTASDEAVDARLALLERLQNEAFAAAAESVEREQETAAA